MGAPFQDNPQIVTTLQVTGIQREDRPAGRGRGRPGEGDSPIKSANDGWIGEWRMWPGMTYPSRSFM